MYYLNRLVRPDADESQVSLIGLKEKGRWSKYVQTHKGIFLLHVL